LVAGKKGKKTGFGKKGKKKKKEQLEQDVTLKKKGVQMGHRKGVFIQKSRGAKGSQGESLCRGPRGAVVKRGYAVGKHQENT